MTSSRPVTPEPGREPSRLGGPSGILDLGPEAFSGAIETVRSRW
ncbi:hypothetical protein ACFU6S_12315 [Streptomyces sp. NPDC057456]